jgi:hypothetical protein
MLDIETLGTNAGAIVLSIGAVKFSGKALASNESEKFGEEFYAVLDINTQLLKCRTRDDATVAWWQKQPIEARKEAFDNPHREDTLAVLNRFYDFLSNDFAFDAIVWGNGSDFDNAIVADLYRSYGFKELPWMFWNNRCFRTFKSEFKSIASEPLFEGVKHHALHDAKHQARWLQQIKSKINRNIALY